MAGNKKNKGIRILGLTISVSTLAIVILYFWLRSMDNLFSDWIATNNILIFITTTILVIVFIAFGLIKIRRNILKKGVI